MPGSNVYMNWGTTSITPTAPSGSAITLDTILDLKVNGQSVQKLFYGDNRAFARLIRNTRKTRTITIKLANVGVLATIPEDAECTISAVFLDAINIAGSGAITVTAVRAKRGSSPFGGQENEFGMGEVTFQCAGGDNDTDPVTIAVAA